MASSDPVFDDSEKPLFLGSQFPKGEEFRGHRNQREDVIQVVRNGFRSTSRLDRAYGSGVSQRLDVFIQLFRR